MKKRKRQRINGSKTTVDMVHCSRLCKCESIRNTRRERDRERRRTQMNSSRQVSFFSHVFLTSFFISHHLTLILASLSLGHSSFASRHTKARGKLTFSCPQRERRGGTTTKRHTPRQIDDGPKAKLKSIKKVKLWGRKGHICRSTGAHIASSTKCRRAQDRRTNRRWRDFGEQKEKKIIQMRINN